MKRKTSPLLLLGILSVFTLAQTATIINPALNSLSEYYSGLSYSTILLLSTVVSLAVIPCSLLAGEVAGQKISYKALSILSTLLILVGGMLPFLTMPSFSVVFFCRLLVGAGIGFSSPIANALVMRLIPADRQALWQGIGTAVMNVAGVLYQNLSGMVCMADLRYIWLVHGLLLLPLLLIILFLKEPEKTSHFLKQGTLSSDIKNSGKDVLIAAIWLLIHYLKLQQASHSARQISSSNSK